MCIVSDIIGVTEVKRKNGKNIINLQEYNLDFVGDYNVFQANIDNNVQKVPILYTHKTLLNVTEVTMETEFQGIIFAKLNLGKSDELVVRLIYRSPSCDGENNTKLRDLMTKVLVRINLSWEILITTILTGEFGIHVTQAESDEYLFLENVWNSYFTQRVSQLSRFRGDDEPSISYLQTKRRWFQISSVRVQLGKAITVYLSFILAVTLLLNLKRKRKDFTIKQITIRLFKIPIA